MVLMHTCGNRSAWAARSGPGIFATWAGWAVITAPTGQEVRIPPLSPAIRRKMGLSALSDELSPAPDQLRPGPRARAHVRERFRRRGERLGQELDAD